MRDYDNEKGYYDQPDMLANICSCFFPIVGIVLYLVWKDEKPNKAQSVCQWTIAGVVIGILLGFISACSGAVAGAIS